MLSIYYIIIAQRSLLDLDNQQAVSVCTINFNEEKCKHKKKDKVCIKFSLTEDECKSVTQIRTLANQNITHLDQSLKDHPAVRNDRTHVFEVICKIFDQNLEGKTNINRDVSSFKEGFYPEIDRFCQAL